MNRRTANPVGRPRKRGEVLSIERPIKWAPSVYERLVAKAEETNKSIAEVIRTATVQSLDAEDHPRQPNPNELLVPGLEETDIKEFAQLAKKVIHIDEPETFARILINKALDMGPEVMREFIFGSSERILEAMKEENDARAGHEAERLNLPKPAASKTRRAA